MDYVVLTLRKLECSQTARNPEPPLRKDFLGLGGYLAL